MQRVRGCCGGRGRRADHGLPAECQVPGHCRRQQGGGVPGCLLSEWWGRQRGEYRSSQLLHEPLVDTPRLRLVPDDGPTHQLHHQTEHLGRAQPLPVALALSRELEQRTDLAQFGGDASDGRRHCSPGGGDVCRSRDGQNLAQFSLHPWPLTFQVSEDQAFYDFVFIASSFRVADPEKTVARKQELFDQVLFDCVMTMHHNYSGSGSTHFLNFHLAIALTFLVIDWPYLQVLEVPAWYTV